MKAGKNRSIAFLFAGMIVLPALTGLALAGCHTSHDIHITLDIRLIEAEVGDPGTGTKSLGGGAEALLSPSDIELTPVLKAAIEARRARLAAVRQLKISKKVGENHQGLLVVPRGTEPLLGEERMRVSQILREENRDRETIFAEIAKIRKTPALEVRQYWAEQFRLQMNPNEWFQTPEDPGFVLRFQASELGKAFSSAPAKGSWVRVPPAYMPGKGM